MKKLIAAGTTLAALTSVGLARQATAEAPAAVIRYTEYGIPHITASSFGGLGEGYGYAAAKDNLCVLADSYLMVNAERSLHLGPEGKVSPSIQAAATTNLNSDLNFQRINDSGVIERILDQPPGPADHDAGRVPARVLDQPGRQRVHRRHRHGPAAARRFEGPARCRHRPQDRHEAEGEP